MPPMNGEGREVRRPGAKSPRGNKPSSPIPRPPNVVLSLRMFKRIAIWAAILAQPLSTCCYACCPCPQRAAKPASKSCCPKRSVAATPKCCRVSPKTAKCNPNPSTCCDELSQSPERCAAERERVRHLMVAAAPAAFDAEVGAVPPSVHVSFAPGFRACFDSNNPRQASLGVWLK